MVQEAPVFSARSHGRAVDVPTDECAARACDEDRSEKQLPEFVGTPVWKVCFDRVAAFILLVLLSPIFILVAIYIKLVSRGPVLFTQSRLGAGCRPFLIFKFRTMYQDLEAEASYRDYVGSLARSHAAAEKQNNRERLIPGGRFLREHSIDELPQLLNVLLGTMSLVGPRPEVLELEDYPDWQLRRFEVLPGMTGLWQTSGKNRLSFTRMVELDIEYIDRRSLWLDITLLWKTIAVVVLSDGE